MKHLKYILTMCSFLLMAIACTNSDEPTTEDAADNWVISRSTGSGDIRMVGTPKKGHGTAFDKTLSFDGNNRGTWSGGVPAWNVNEVFDLYAISPVDKPENDIVDARIAYQMQFWSDRVRSNDPQKENRPTEFALKHLHGQLKVHIDIHELDTEEHLPLEVKIRLYTKGRINYPNEKLETNGNLETVELTGWKHDNWEVGTTGNEVDHKWVMEDPILVIPQTLVSDGQPVVTFHIEDKNYGTANYEFTPGAALELLPGKLTHLYLGVAYNHEEEEVEPTITVKGITVTDWVEGEVTNGTATPK